MKIIFIFSLGITERERLKEKSKTLYNDMDSKFYKNTDVMVLKLRTTKVIIFKVYFKTRTM